MTAEEWTLVAMLAGAGILAGSALIALWPERSPLDEGFHRARGERTQPPAATLVQLSEDTATWPVGITEDADEHQPRHGWDQLGEHTRPLTARDLEDPGDEPLGPRPMHPWS